MNYAGAVYAVIGVGLPPLRAIAIQYLTTPIASGREFPIVLSRNLSGIEPSDLKRK